MQQLIDAISAIVSRNDDENKITNQVARTLKDELSAGLAVPDWAQRPDSERYVMYPLYVAPDGSFSIASAVWNVGQGTPVHGHETWGVVGIHSGQEHELSFVKPTEPETPLVRLSEHVWDPGQVTICCTTDDDVHQVWCEGDVPVVGIHVYGADIGTLRRRSYNPETGAVDWFVSRWTERSEQQARTSL